MQRLVMAVWVGAVAVCTGIGAELPVVSEVEAQPLAAQIKRLVAALEYLGHPLEPAERAALLDAMRRDDVRAMQTILDRHCLAGVRIRRDGRLDYVAGSVAAELVEQGWRLFLVKVLNEAARQGVELVASSPQAMPIHVPSSGRPDPKVISLGEVKERFLDLEMYQKQPLVAALSGLEVEYRILHVYARDAGRRPAQLRFGLREVAAASGPGQRPLGRVIAESPPGTILFTIQPATVVRLRVRDHDGTPTTAALVIRDQQGRVYPAPGKRLAPDFFFHAQIYRHDGETVLLPPGTYTFVCRRGPEYLVSERQVTIPQTFEVELAFELRRWVYPARRGWYSGDHHVHAAGCAHYESPTEGVTPEDMMRHILGEDLNVGCVLSWGPCWYHQKRYFEGKPHRLSLPNYIMRYDVEVSGFPSSHCGHLCLLRLKEDDYPGTRVIEDWPSWDLPILRWAKAQGAVVGFAHSSWGLQPLEGNPEPTELPNYLLPRMNGIGANEYLVDLAHDAVDFISAVDTPAVLELNIWYHTLQCGFRAKISGETDFPCIFGERVGIGRSYVCLDGKPLQFDDWAEGIKKGRSYVSDGKSHLLDFRIDGVGVGQGEVHLDKPGVVEVRASVAALLEPQPTPETERIRKSSLYQKPYWDLERARIGTTRRVPLEVVVNGAPVARQEILADGSEQEVRCQVPIEKSSWVCLHIFPSSHTNPIFVLVGRQPVRASRRSAEWCLRAIDQCWKEKAPLIRPRERSEAELAYEEARRRYRQILAECTAP